MKSAFAALIVLGAAKVVSPTANSDGRLSQYAVPSFTVGFQQANERGEITERVPNGETVERWSSMLTDQRFTGVAQRLTPQAYAANIFGAIPTFCPAGKGIIMNQGQVSRRPAVTLRVDCPKNPATGLPETNMMLVVAGPRDMHVRQIAWRRLPTVADLEFAQTYFRATSWCTRTKKGFAC
ncbi:MAG TPA: hypothetical protein PK479_03185 [Novosphingobium sp.]|nr:hypothetical protein [Novosphingobium sp.]